MKNSNQILSQKYSLIQEADLPVFNDLPGHLHTRTFNPSTDSIQDVTDPDGTKLKKLTRAGTRETCWLNSAGLYHRTDGPAFIKANFESWWKNGTRHRLDGPAKIWYASNSRQTEYWIDGRRMDSTEFYKYIKARKVLNKDNPGIPTEF